MNVPFTTESQSLREAVSLPSLLGAGILLAATSAGINIQMETLSVSLW
jgi:hypothetical protein